MQEIQRKVFGATDLDEAVASAAILKEANCIEILRHPKKIRALQARPEQAHVRCAHGVRPMERLAMVGRKRMLAPGKGSTGPILVEVRAAIFSRHIFSADASAARDAEVLSESCASAPSAVMVSRHAKTDSAHVYVLIACSPKPSPRAEHGGASGTTQCVQRKATRRGSRWHPNKPPAQHPSRQARVRAGFIAPRATMSPPAGPAAQRAPGTR